MDASKKADYTNTFCNLMDLGPKKEVIYDDKDFLIWKKRWKERLLKNTNTFEKSVVPLSTPPIFNSGKS